MKIVNIVNKILDITLYSVVKMKGINAYFKTGMFRRNERDFVYLYNEVKMINRF